MTYHVARNNQQLGAFAKADTLARYRRGEILPTDLVWTEGMTTWQPATQVLGVPAAPAAATATQNAPPPIPSPVIGYVKSPLGIATPIYAANANLPPKPDNNLVGAILVTVLCCVPLGIASIVCAAQVDGKYFKGDYAGAEESAKKSRTFMWWSLGLTLAVIFLGLMVNIITTTLNR